MEWSDFLSLMRDGDGIDTKFFGSFISADKLGPILVAMANTRGGNVVIGFDKRNYHLLGTYVDESFIKDLIDTYCYPKPEFSFDICTKNDKRIVIIHVKASPLKPYYYNNKCYVLNPERSSLSILEKDVLQDDRTYSFNRVPDSRERATNQGSRDDRDSVEDEHSIRQLQDLHELTDELVQLHDVDTKPVSDKHAITSTERVDSDDTQPEVIQSDLSEDIVVTRPVEQLSMNQVEVRALTKRQEDALEYLAKNAFIKNKLYRSLYSVSHKTAHLELVDLVQRNLIVSQGSGRSTCYVIDETCKRLADLVRH